MLYSAYADEILALINAKHQGSPLKKGDLVFKLLSEKDGLVTVEVSPATGVVYYGEQIISYRKRELAKALLGVPVSVVITNNATMRRVLALFSSKYGFSFDVTLDFAQEELEKTVDFGVSGMMVVELPTSSESLIWMGKLSITVANDGLDLATIIVNDSVTGLEYLHRNQSVTSSLAIATYPGDYSELGTELAALAIGAKIPRDLANRIRDMMVAQKLVPDNTYSSTSWLGLPLSLNTLVENKIIDGWVYGIYTSTAAGGWDGGAVLKYRQPGPSFEVSVQSPLEITIKDAKKSGIQVPFFVDPRDSLLFITVALTTDHPDAFELTSDSLQYVADDGDSSVYLARIATTDTTVVGSTCTVTAYYEGQQVGQSQVVITETPAIVPDPTNYLRASIGPGALKISVSVPTTHDAAPWYKLDNGIKLNLTDGMIKSVTITEQTTIEVGWNNASTDVRISVGGAALISVDQFDKVGNVSTYDFKESPNLVKLPATLPTTVTYLPQMLYKCTSYNGAEIVGWDVSHVKDFTQMLEGGTSFNQDLSGWNVAAATSYNRFNTDANADWVADTTKQPKWPTA